MAIVTITTNLNATDAYLGALKGGILSFYEQIHFIEIATGLKNFDIKQAALTLRLSWHFFPKNTIHLLHQNIPDEGSELAIVRHQGHYFIAFNNGGIPLMLGRQPEESAVLSFDKKQGNALFINEIGYVIHSLIQQKPLHSIAEKSDLNYLTMLPCIVTEGFIKGTIEYVDSFGNLISNITKTDFEKAIGNRNFVLQVSGTSIKKLSNTYNDVGAAEPLAFFNMNNLLEIAINQGSFYSLMGARRESKVMIEAI